MRVFLDANVLLAAVATEGVCRKLLDVIVEDHELLLSKQVIDEYCHYVVAKLGVPMPRAIEGLKRFQRAEIVVLTGECPVALKDPDDHAVLLAAICGKADLLVSGDRHLLDPAEEISRVAGIRVLSPRQAIEVLAR